MGVVEGLKTISHNLFPTRTRSDKALKWAAPELMQGE